MSQTEENKHIEEQLQGEDYTLKIDSEFRERLINELRHFPNIFVIAGDHTGASHTMQGDNDQLARCIIHIFKQNPELKEWFQKLFQYV